MPLSYWASAVYSCGQPRKHWPNAAVVVGAVAEEAGVVVQGAAEVGPAVARGLVVVPGPVVARGLVVAPGLVADDKPPIGLHPLASPAAGGQVSLAVQTLAAGLVAAEQISADQGAAGQTSAADAAASVIELMLADLVLVAGLERADDQAPETARAYLPYLPRVRTSAAAEEWATGQESVADPVPATAGTDQVWVPPSVPGQRSAPGRRWVETLPTACLAARPLRCRDWVTAALGPANSLPIPSRIGGTH
jgi:hypothetical protein